jgi:hypothetical protein
VGLEHILTQEYASSSYKEFVPNRTEMAAYDEAWDDYGETTTTADRRQQRWPNQFPPLDIERIHNELAGIMINEDGEVVELIEESDDDSTSADSDGWSSESNSNEPELPKSYMVTSDGRKMLMKRLIDDHRFTPFPTPAIDHLPLNEDFLDNQGCNQPPPSYEPDVHNNYTSHVQNPNLLQETDEFDKSPPRSPASHLTREQIQHLFNLARKKDFAYFLDKMLHYLQATGIEGDIMEGDTGFQIEQSLQIPQGAELEKIETVDNHLVPSAILRYIDL